MKIITTDMPKYTAVFDHPDDSPRSYDFFVDLGDDKSPWTDEEFEEYHKELIKEVWNRYNRCGYFHTMTITAEYVIDGQIYYPVICEEYGLYEVLGE